MAEWKICPSCNLRHSARPDGLCPRCHKPLEATGVAVPSSASVTGPDSPVAVTVIRGEKAQDPLKLFG